MANKNKNDKEQHVVFIPQLKATMPIVTVYELNEYNNRLSGFYKLLGICKSDEEVEYLVFAHDEPSDSPVLVSVLC